MKLYYSKGACSLAVRILINEMQLPCEYESVNLKIKQTETGKDFYKINPKGSVPALELDSGVVLTENAVIQQYLAETYNATKLLPAISDPERYHVLEWLGYIATELHKNCAPFFNPAIPEQIKEDIFKPLLKTKFKLVEQQLSKHKYLQGDHLTLPDCYLFVILCWLPSIKLDITAFPNTLHYFDNLKTHESVMKSLKQEGLLEKIIG